MINLIWNNELWHHPKDDKIECKGWTCDHFRIDPYKCPGNSCCLNNNCKFKKNTRKAVENPREISGHFATKSSQRFGNAWHGNWSE